jgi:hypothetical protein
MNRVYGFALTGALLCMTIISQFDGSLAQSGRAAGANLQIDIPEVVAEVRAAHERYERALVSNDDAILGASFRNDPRTVRYGNAENLYGYAEIEAYRARSSGPGPACWRRP